MNHTPRVRVPFEVALLALVLLVPSVAGAQGMLIPRDESIEPLRLTSHEVEVEITDNGAVTHVTQVFENRTSQNLEATYYFAVPPGAVTTDFALWMNGERIRGEVLERNQARQIYEGIVRRMRDPGLLEYVDGELFQASIFPIPPNGDQRVEIEFANVMQREGNLLHYRYPIHESASREIPQLEIAGRIASTHPITRVYSPYHDIEETVDRDGHSARFSLEESRASVDQDFELFIGQSGDDIGFSLLTFDGDDGEDAYFMVTIAPSPELEDLEVLPKQVTFVVDTSGSMAGEKIDQAREMLRFCVENLDDRDKFQIIAFSSTVRPAFDEPVLANRTNVAQALDFIAAISARGNTNISGALERALEDEVDEDRPNSIIFVTDGLPTEGNTDIDDIIEMAAHGAEDDARRVFAFGVGYDVNTRLLDGVARRGRGEAGYVRPSEDISDIVGEFFSSIGAPLLTNIELDFGGVEVDQLYPNPLPDLYRDRDVTVFGRLNADHSGSVVVRGRAGGGSYVREYGADFESIGDADTSFVGNLWARRRIDHLLAEIDEEGSTQRRVDQIVSLATQWGIVTPYTSYLAVDPSERQVTNPRQPEPWEWIADEPRRAPIGAGTTAVDELEATSTLRRNEGADGAGGLSGGETAYRGRNQGAPAPAAAAAPRPEVGREAVEERIARSESLSADARTDRDTAGTRFAAGHSFSAVGQLWVQAEASGRAVDRRVGYMSDEYFELLRENPELRDVFALGPRVRFVLEGRVYEID